MSEAPKVVAITKALQNGIADTYIVRLKDDRDQASHMRWVREQQWKYTGRADICRIKNEFKVIKGYSAVLTGAALHDLAKCPDVKTIVQDRRLAWGIRPGAEVPLYMGERQQMTGQAILAATAPPVGVSSQSNAPWGLERLSRIQRLPEGSDPSKLRYYYRYNNSVRVVDVDAYVLDTGVKLNHKQFGGRARFGCNFTKEVDHDIDGHGTHVAGILGGETSEGCGVYQAVQGIDWVIERAKASGNPSVMNLSFVLEGGPNQDLDDATSRAANQGIHVIAAAGNDNLDASNTSPARVADIMVVGASTIRDERWVEPNFPRLGSNFGACVRVFAPGANVMSAGIRSTTHLVPNTGTSMAAPHVAGLIAYFIRKDGNRTPAEMIAYIQDCARMNVLGKVPKGTVNPLAYSKVV